MLDREKLIELLLGAEKSADEHGFFNSIPSQKKAEFVADFLLDNGVTFAKDMDVPSKWISVEDRKPDEEWKRFTKENKADVYPCLCCRWNDLYHSIHYVTKLHFDGEYFVDLYNVIQDEYVTHWMPLPEPPGGE